MIVIKNLEVENYRNIRRADLNQLSDLNILIGPNNCGKTNLAELISSLQRLEVGGQHDYLCPSCSKSIRVGVAAAGMRLEGIRSEDHYLRDPGKFQITLRILFDREQTEKVAPRILKQQEQRLSGILPGWDTPGVHSIDPPQNKDAITMRSSGSELRALHLSPFIHPGIIHKLVLPIVYCPDRRLESYKKRPFAQFLQEAALTSSQKTTWIEFLRNIVDPMIVDEKRNNLLRRVEDKDLEVLIDQQGSGVRSLACLAAELLFTDAKVVLVDEPELGLNPFVKQEFLAFLLEQSKRRQIFLATHDPTFVNPTIWTNTSVSVYFYSLKREEFVKVDLAQSKEDPDTFAGYMPHTTSLKRNHIYVEGASDVHIFQIFLHKHLQREKTLQEQNRVWPDIWNKIGIYHLGGDFWQHLLYTVPKYPYRCIVVLDGDKEGLAREICSQYNQKKLGVPTFKLCESLQELIATFGSDYAHPVYCLQKDCIEEYFEPPAPYKDPTYDKKKEGPKRAAMMDYVPREIQNLFNLILVLEPPRF